jgi:O-phosphoseryl-tRNA(Cys) synthetase
MYLKFEKIINILWKEHTEEMKNQLRSFKKGSMDEHDLVCNTHMGYGLYIRNRFHLRDNDSSYIIEKLWEKANSMK